LPAGIGEEAVTFVGGLVLDCAEGREASGTGTVGRLRTGAGVLGSVDGVENCF
jgi:hypothetical protein